MGKSGYGIPERIRRYRELRGYTQRELAARIGGGHSTIASIEAGRVQGRVDTIDAIARCLGTTVDELLHGGMEQSMADIPADNIPADVYEFVRNPGSWKNVRALKAYMSKAHPTAKEKGDFLLNLE